MDNEFESALQSGILLDISRLATSSNVNSTNASGETTLEIAIDWIEDSVLRFEAVKFLLQAGADPNFRPSGECGSLFSAVLKKDASLIQLLLEYGASPNILMDGGEPFYDWCEFDYRYDEYDLHLPEEPSPEDKVTEDAWLKYLDRLAVKHGKRRPDYLFAIRRYGGKTWAEINSST